jgi:hypothetical protein
MHRGRRCIFPSECIGTQPVAGCRLIIVDREHGFEVKSRFIGQAGLPSALRFGQVLLNAGPHGEIDAEQCESVKERTELCSFSDGTAR